jgi:hypothetical protein
VSTPAFDLFRMDPSGNPVWIDMVADLTAAAKYLKQLARTAPGEYFVFSQEAQKIVVVEDSKEQHL